MKNKDLVYMAVYIALALVLDYVSQLIPFLQMPQGGSINLAVIPVIISSYHLGWKKGLSIGFMWWIVGFLFLGLNRWYLNPMQYLFDYIIPALVLGLACLFHNNYVGTSVTVAIRFLSTLISGALYWPPEGALAGSQAAWIGSFTYNLYYNLGTLVVALILVPILMKRVKFLNN